MPPCALFVGSAGVGKFSLARALGAQPDAKSDANEYSLTLDTKYYTAHVLLRCVDPRHSLPSSVEALVLVFDASDARSFDSIRSWADQQDAQGIDVKVVVANKVDQLQQNAGAASREPWLEDAISWCCNGAYEFIEAAAGQPSTDAQLQADGEQQGAARVLAALQAHMWPGMVPKAWKPGTKQLLPRAGAGAGAPDKPTGKQASGGSSSSSGTRDQGLLPAAALAGPGAAVEAAGGDEDDAADDAGLLRPRATPSPLQSAALQQQQQAQVQPAAKPSSGTLRQQQAEEQQQAEGQEGCKASDSSEAAAATPAGIAAAAAAAADGGDAVSSSGADARAAEQRLMPAAVAAGAAAGDDDSDDDSDDDLMGGLELDDFEQLMKQVQGMRSRLSGLPDDERRAAAADMAMRLAAAMGLGADGEEGDAWPLESDSEDASDVVSRLP